jgi:hypothetical protein
LEDGDIGGGKMKTWKIYVTFFKNLYDEHYLADQTWNPSNFSFVKVNDRYPMELEGNKLPYEIVIEHDFPIFRDDFQENGYCENSVIWHLYKNGEHQKYDFIGFIEYDHVLSERFTEDIQRMLDAANADIIFSFQPFTYRQLYDQGILMNPGRRDKVDGNPDSPWNAVSVVLDDYNEFHNTSYTLENLEQKNCFPICHSLLMPSSMFDRIMGFHSYVMESGKVEGYHRHNWRSPAGLMERYLAVSLALEKAPINTSIQLEHRDLPVKVLKPDWFKLSAWRRFVAYFQKKF